MDDGAKALSAQNVPVPLVAEGSSAECPLSSLLFHCVFCCGVNKIIFTLTHYEKGMSKLKITRQKHKKKEFTTSPSRRKA